MACWQPCHCCPEATLLPLEAQCKVKSWNLCDAIPWWVVVAWFLPERYLLPSFKKSEATQLFLGGAGTAILSTASNHEVDPCDFPTAECNPCSQEAFVCWVWAAAIAPDSNKAPQFGHQALNLPPTCKTFHWADVPLCYCVLTIQYAKHNLLYRFSLLLGLQLVKHFTTIFPAITCH